MKKRKTTYTMADVARLAGVSAGTVSNVLNNRTVVSKHLSKRVQDAVAALGFSPDRGARGLRTGRTHIIGMVIPDITNPHYAEITRGVEDAAIENGYELMVCNSRRQAELEQRHMHALRAQRVDGIIVNCSNCYHPRDLLPRYDLPLVFVGAVPMKSKINCIVTNNVEVSQEATEHLIRLGHRRIAIISAEMTYSTMIERLEGYRRAMAEAALPVEPKYVVEGATEIESGLHGGIKLLSLPEPPTAIYALNNRVALGVMQALKELRIPCPEQVSVMMFDDPDWARSFSPSITAIEQPTYQIGVSAVQLLLKSLRSPDGNVEHGPEQVELKSCLHVRESTGPVAQELKFAIGT
jgi:LacI family transcriptional regulator